MLTKTVSCHHHARWRFSRAEVSRDSPASRASAVNRRTSLLATLFLRTAAYSSDESGETAADSLTTDATGVETNDGSASQTTGTDSGASETTSSDSADVTTDSASGGACGKGCSACPGARPKERQGPWFQWAGCAGHASGCSAGVAGQCALEHRLYSRPRLRNVRTSAASAGRVRRGRRADLRKSSFSCRTC